MVLTAETADRAAADRSKELQREILSACRAALAQHKVPAAIRFVPQLEVLATGKLARHA